MLRLNQNQLVLSKFQFVCTLDRQGRFPSLGGEHGEKLLQRLLKNLLPVTGAVNVLPKLCAQCALKDSAQMFAHVKCRQH